MAISRNMMERQLRADGGIMTLDEPRQKFFLGKIVRKAKKAVKKVVKSPLGKIALTAAAANFAPMLLGKQTLLSQAGGFGGLGSLIKGSLGTGGKLSSIGNLFKVGGVESGAISIPRILGGIGIGSALAAPFLMGGEEEVDEGVPVTGIQPMVANIRQQARDYYQDPTKSALYFMPPKSAVQSSFFGADGGLADIPRGGYDNGGDVMTDAEREQRLIDLADYFMERGMSESEAYETAAKQLYAYGGRVGFSEGTNIKKKLKKIGYEDTLLDTMSLKELINLLNSEEGTFTDSSVYRPGGAEGGLMDLGGMEKDYREGGFVPIGAEERADDVPARLSKNEFVFTADAVRNAGGGDIDKGAEVMQNMMDNLEAGGMISEESQGMENPAQAMFDQAQMLEGRLA